MFDVADLNVDDNKVLTLIMQNRLIRQKNMREQLYKNIYNNNVFQVLTVITIII